MRTRSNRDIAPDVPVDVTAATSPTYVPNREPVEVTGDVEEWF